MNTIWIRFLGQPNTNDDGERQFIEGSEYDKACNVCAVEGGRLLRIPQVQERLTILLNELLEDKVVDSQLAKVIMQDDDFTPKVAAIKEYNKLRGRIIDHTKVTNVQKLDMDDIRVLISSLPKERQEFFYATISDLFAEAELSRSSGEHKESTAK